KPLGDLAGVLDVLAGAARAGPADGDAVVVELQGDADDVITLLLQERGRDRRIDAAVHRAHRAGVARRLVDTEGIRGHGGAYIGAPPAFGPLPSKAGGRASPAGAPCRARPWRRR